MTKEKQIYEISILGRAIWSLHSLNNEGTIGNVTEPRSLRIIDPDTGKAFTTDGISGEMLKHIHAVNLWGLVNKSQLCDACKKLDPNRAQNNQKAQGPREKIISIAITECALCDLHGFLTERGPTPREASIEFGWTAGITKIGEKVMRETHIHARHSIESAYVEETKGEGKWDGQKCNKRGCETKEDDSNLYKVKNKWYCSEHIPVTQMPYHRPTRSGIYAVISVFQPWRIGLNNVTMNYENIDRQERFKLALKAYQAMFLRTEGAMTTTRLPHTKGFEGLIVVSKTNFPTPVISPLKDSYKKDIQKINTEMRNIFTLVEFNSLDEFVKAINELAECVPYEIKL